MQVQENQTGTLQERYTGFQAILSDAELTALFEKYGIEDIRKRKFSVYHFFGSSSYVPLSQVREAVFCS